MLVSIIMPVFNAEKFLGRSIESVINQSYGDIELILVNDGSTDSSEKICKKYSLADKRIRIISQENRGPAAARNVGIRNSSGYFIYFLDADDYIQQNAIELLVTNYDKYEPDLVMSNFGKSLNDGPVVKQNVSFTPENVPFDKPLATMSKGEIADFVCHFLEHPSNHLVSYCWARLYKASIIKEQGIFSNEDMGLFEDFVFNLEYLRHTGSIVFVNEPTYVYTMNDNHVSASMAVINGDGLLHDMEIFRSKAAGFLHAMGAGMSEGKAQKRIGHALTHYVIIFVVRSCRQITKENKEKISQEIDKIIRAPILRQCLGYYSPSKGNSRMLPLLMKIKSVGLVIALARYKAYRRYGKIKAV